ncbi:MAG TPA: carboxypeptidase-like regulatory domain-containing protein [Vicinamibacterales bacterium]|nr:carboxypeptidase-like regulatory domain-containing protein [Vicinamibacterales bacterium]
MRRSLAAVVALALVATLPVPSAAAIAAPRVRKESTGSVEGIARDAQRQPLARHTVQIRDVQTGQLAGTGTTSSAGQFTFSGIAPGSYVVEVLNAAGQMVGTSAAFRVAAGTVAMVTVTASPMGALRRAGGLGFGLFGLGSAATAAILAGATVGIVVGVIATRDEASPSR